MSRKEFMEQLAYLLQDIPQEERQAALDYYEGYFEEAGDEREEDVTARLGSPEKAAAEIKMGINSRSTENGHSENGSYTERGYEDERFTEPPQSPQKWKLDEEKKERHGRFRQWWDRQSSVMRLVWFGIFLFVFFSLAGKLLDVFFGIAGGALGLIFGIFGLLVGVFAGAFGIMAAFFGGAIGLVGTGIAKLFVSPTVGLLYCGLGCLSAAAGILMCFVCIWLCSKVVPAMVRGIAGLFGKILHGRRRSS